MSAQTLSRQTLSRDLALRIGLAARALPETDPRRLLRVLADCVGLPLTTEKLGRLTVRDLRSAAQGELADLSPEHLRRALRLLSAEETVVAPEEPAMQPADAPAAHMPHSIRVAVASNGAERADGHFGSCAQFLIYQVSGTDAKLVDLRPATVPPSGQDKNEHRAKLIGDCQLLFVSSIGGPAAAKVVKAGVHPIKVTGEPSTDSLLHELQAVLAASPPPWLARTMGIPAELTCHTRFCRDTE